MTTKQPGKTLSKRAKPAPPPVNNHKKAAASESVKVEFCGPAPEQMIELFPNGISVGSALGRPVLILKDKSGVEVLPVWMQSLDAGVALAEMSHTTGATPHSVTRRVLEALGMYLESCTFVEIVGHHQYVLLTLRSTIEGSDLVKTLKVRADEAMSFCLQGRTRFFSAKSLMVTARSLDADLTRFEENLVHGQLPQLTAEIEVAAKKQPYMM